MTLQEAIDIVEKDTISDVKGIYIEPPDINVNSDEDSAEEDEGGLVDNLNKRQLKSQAEIIISDDIRIDDFETYEKSKSDHSDRERKKQSKKKVKHFSWKNEDLQETNSIFPETNYSAYRNQTPLQIFEKIIDREFYEHIINETTRYATQKM